MPIDASKNFARSTVLAAPSPATAGLTLTVASGDGVKFPIAPFNAVVCPTGSAATPVNAEVVRVTAVSITTGVLTILRAQEGSAARTILMGDQIFAGPTAKSFTDIQSSINLKQDIASAVAGPAGPIGPAGPTGLTGPAGPTGAGTGDALIAGTQTFTGINTFTQSPVIPTVAVSDSSTKAASTAYVIGQAATTVPVINGTAAAGTATRFSRADHVHPTDTSLASVAAVADLEALIWTGGL